MPVTVSESYNSRPFQLGNQSGRELIYDVVGSEDETEVSVALYAESPAVYLGLRRESVSAEPQGRGVWKGYVRYSGLDDDSEYTFATSGATQRITQSIATISRYAPPGETAPDFEGAIGVSEDRVEGVDIVVPTFEWTETHRLPNDAVTAVDTDYLKILSLLTGRQNNNTFRGYDAGEILFMGAEGSLRADELWSITFRFARSPNVVDETIAGIDNVSKLGWDYLWIRYEEAEDDSAFALVKRPSSIHVDRVYFPGDFSLLGIGTGELPGMAV